MHFTNYEHSGRPGRAWLLVTLLGLPAVALLSLIYSYIVVYIPIGGVLTLFIMGGYVFGMGFIISWLGHVAKCRSQMTMRLLGAISGIVALWLAWVFFLYALINRNEHGGVKVLDLVLHPDAMWQIACEVAESGWYTIKKTTPSGAVLWSFWGIEATVVIGGVILMAPAAITQEMFCETCDGWCPVKETKFLHIDDKLSKTKLEHIEILPLFTLPSSDTKVIPSIRTELLECAACKLSKGIRFIRMTMTTDKEGKTSENAENLPGIYIPPAR